METKEKGPIIVIEPQCRGFEHVRFNAPFLQTLACAGFDKGLIFLAEKEHLDQVRIQLEIDSPRLARRIEWAVIPVPERQRAGWIRYPAEKAWIRRALEFARAREARLMILTSATMPGLFALSRATAARSLRVLACLHAELRWILSPLIRHPGRWGWDPSHVLRFSGAKKFDYLALGRELRKDLLSLAPYLDSSRWHAIEHPFHFREEGKARPGDLPSKAVFGFFGTAVLDQEDSRGFAAYCDLADRIRKKGVEVEFRLVGFVHGRRMSRDEVHFAAIEGVGHSPLSGDEFSRRARGVSHAVFTAPPEARRLLASTSFLESLNFVKPGVYLRNPYLDDYLDTLGDLGYACRDLADLEGTLEGIARSFPRERYARQVDAIRKGRGVFSPEVVARDLEPILTRILGSSG